MNNFPLISVVMCTYNGEKYIEEQLDSILNQTYQNLEIIIVDDVSKDNTWQILQTYQQKFSNIAIYKNEINLGYIKNFEGALQKATGELIAIADQDDIWEKGKLTQQQENIGSNILIYHDSALIKQDGSLMNKNISTHIKMYEGGSFKSLIFDNCVSGHSMLFKKELLSYIFPFPTIMHYDWWMATVALANGTIRYLPQPLVQYRQHENNVTNITGSNKKDKPKTRELKKQLRIYNKRKEYQDILLRFRLLNNINFKSQTDKKFLHDLQLAFEEKGHKTRSHKLFMLLFKNIKIIFFVRHKNIFYLFKYIIKISFFRRYNAKPNPKYAQALTEYLEK